MAIAIKDPMDGNRRLTTEADADVDVILRDGSTLRLRPPARDDADALVRFFAELSDQSLYLRFHGHPSVDARLVAGDLEPDWAERGALLGAVATDDGERVVTLGSYVRLRERNVAEVAFAVADEYQGRGIGPRLLEQLAARAAKQGIARFVAEVISENRAMLRVFSEAGFSVSRTRSGGVVEVTFPIAATADFAGRVAARDHTAVTASLRPFFEPRSVAVFGASPRRGTIGGELFRNILAGDFSGAGYPINRNGDSVAGVRGYASIADVPDAVDLAVVCVPAAVVLDAAESALRHGVRALIVISAGFAEVGADGFERQRQLLALVRAHGARLIGPNCLGVASAATRLNATFASRQAPAGNIGFSSQSGALGLAMLEVAESRGLGLSAFVSIGNKADVSSNDLLEWWEDDPRTEVVLLYVESFGNPRKFAELARRVARSKPILAVKSGRTASGARAASSHTAALAGAEAAVDALFHQAGVIRAGSLEELVDVATLLSTQPAPRGRGVAVLTNAGGLGIMCADACEAAGLTLPPLNEETRTRLGALLPVEASLANPVDMLGSATAASYGAALPLLLDDPGVDAVIVLFVPAVSATADEVAAAITQVGAGDKPVLAVVISAAGIPAALRAAPQTAAVFVYPESAARALGRAAERADWLRRPVGAVPVLDVNRDAAAAVIDRALTDQDDAWLEPADTRALLLAYGIPLVGEAVAASADEATEVADTFGYPVVVKTAKAGAHKTESGGIALDLGDAAAVCNAFTRIGAPVIVQPMIKGGAELLAGLVQDPVFGPLVAFGPGGVFAELIGDAAFRIAPLTDMDAEELVTTGKAGRLVKGFRGQPPADVASLVDLVCRLSRLGEDFPAVSELDLNPVRALPDGCIAVDARVRVHVPESRPRTKSW
ncbi:MAG: GNAT family N-acetyltransferase [Gaiellaceae bacterium]